MKNKERRPMGMTVGALVAIMWDPSRRGICQDQWRAAEGYKEYIPTPCLCGAMWHEHYGAVQPAHLSKDGGSDKHYPGNPVKVECPDCIEVLKLNGL